MTTITFQATNPCSGGGHATLTVAVDGNTTLETLVAIDDVLGGQPDELTRAERLLALLRVIVGNRTRSQAKQMLAAGVTVTVT